MAYIVNSKDFHTVVGSSENDVINNSYYNNASVDAGDGDDAIAIYDSKKLTVTGGKGNDTIYNYISGNNVINYAAGDGDDVIFGLHSNDTLNITSGSYTTRRSGNDIIVTVTDGNKKANTITLKKAADKQLNVNSNKGLYISNGFTSSNFSASNNNDRIFNFFDDKMTISGGGGDDTLYNCGDSSSIIGDAGNDFIFQGGSKSTINAGTGNDKVLVYGDNNIIKYTGGNDFISIQKGSNNLISLASSNYTTLNLDLNLITDDDDDDYDYGDSEEDDEYVIDYSNDLFNDVMSRSFSKVLINTSEGDSVSVVAQGVVKIQDSNGIKTIDTRSQTEGSNISNSKDNTLISGSKYEDYISSSGSNVTINAGKGNDNIDLYGSGDNVIRYASGDSSEGEEQNFFGYVIKLDGGDTISGLKTNDLLQIDSGDYTVTTSEDGKDVIVNVDGNPVILEDAADRQVRIRKGNNGSATTFNKDKGQYISTTKTNTVLAGTNVSDTIEFGLDYDESDVLDDYGFNSAEGTFETSISDKVTINAGAGNDSIVNGGIGVTINGEAGNDTIEGGGMNVLINGGEGNDVIILRTDYTYDDDDDIFGGYEYDGGGLFDFGFTTISYTEGDGKDTIYGYDGTDTINITGSYSTQVSGNDITIKVGTGSILLKDAKGIELNIGKSGKVNSGGGSTAETTVNLTNTTTSLYTATSTVKTINATARTTAIKIAGNSLANSIIGGSGADSLSGGAGADTLNGGKGNDTLTGGAGNDVFIYQSGQGNDVITDYVAGQDKIKVTGAKVSKASVSGSDVVLTVGSGSIKVKNGKGKKLSLYNNANTLTTTVVGTSSSTTTSSGTSSTTLTVTNSTKSPVTVSSAIKTIDASKRTTTLKITGNALANTIKGGSSVDTIYGGSGNDSILGNNGNDKLFGDAGNDKLLGGNGADSLTGGKGNDTLTGGAGADVFVYATGDGNDVITDYTAQDKLRITGSYSTLTSGSDVVVKVGSGRMTLKNAKGVKLNITKSSSYEERWFTADDDNYISSDVGSILKDNEDIAIACKFNDELEINRLGWQITGARVKEQGTSEGIGSRE